MTYTQSYLDRDRSTLVLLQWSPLATDFRLTLGTATTCSWEVVFIVERVTQTNVVASTWLYTPAVV